MERTPGVAPVSADGVLTPPLSTDSSLQELIEAELRTRLAQEQQQEEEAYTVRDQDRAGRTDDHAIVASTDLKASRLVVDQPESIMELEPAADVAAPPAPRSYTQATESSTRTEVARADSADIAPTELVSSDDPQDEATPDDGPAMPETCIDDEPATEAVGVDTDAQTADATGDRRSCVGPGEQAESTEQAAPPTAEQAVIESSTSDRSNSPPVEDSSRLPAEDSPPPAEDGPHRSSKDSPLSAKDSPLPAEDGPHLSAEGNSLLPAEDRPPPAEDGPHRSSEDSPPPPEDGPHRFSEDSPPPAEDGPHRSSEDSPPPAEDGPHRSSDDCPAEDSSRHSLRSTDGEEQHSSGDVLVPSDSHVEVKPAFGSPAPEAGDIIAGDASKVSDEDSDEGVGDGTVSQQHHDAQKQQQRWADDAKKLRRKKSDADADGRARSGFGKDEPADHTRIHVRSFDSSKAIQKFSKDPAEATSSQCRSCGRQVFQMERVSAEKAVWHKNCFRCSDCGKQVTVDTYASDEGRLYCVVHHRQLMKDRAAGHVEDSAPRTPVRGDMVVHAEPQPDLPAADVVRSSNKADYGLDDLQNLNVKDRFSVFERHNDDDQERGPASVEVKRSQSILNKMKKFQDRGQPRDNGAGHDSGDESGSEASGDERPPPRDPDVVRSTRKHKKERPMSFSGMGDVKSRFEGGVRRQPAQDETKGELAKMRGMICGAREHKLAYEEALKEQEALSESKRSHEDASLVVQGNLRASYERAVQEAESPRSASRESPDGVPRGQAASITSRFERGEVATDEMAQQNGTTAAQDGAEEVTSELADTTQAESSDVPTPAEHVADSELLLSDTTKRMLSKFKQMEKSTGKTDDEVSVHREKAHGNARQMLSKFREMQEKAQKEDLPDGPPPPKSFTPPPEEPIAPHSEDTEDGENVNDPDIVRSSQKVPDEFLNKRTDQARSLRDKFETWEPRADKDPAFSVEEDCKPTLEITRNLRAKFESLKEQPKPVDKPQHKASRFIMEPNQAAEICGTCNKRVYAMEKLEVDKRILHKNCFRCSKCNCVLRMDTYTFNAGKLFCTPHFKQMFKTKGNYDEGFGVESRTKNWSNGHAEAATSNGKTSAASRSDAEPAGTNGVKHTANGDSESAHGSDGSVEPELEPQLDDEPVTVVADDAGAGADADVFQQVYESALAEAI